MFIRTLLCAGQKLVKACFLLSYIAQHRTAKLLKHNVRKTTNGSLIKTSTLYQFFVKWQQ